MIIRPATVVDMERCERLSGAYATQYVWQMSENVSSGEMSISFRRARLPRSMQVAYPRSIEGLTEDVQRQECFLVADELGHMLGFLDMIVRDWQEQAWIEHLVVHPPYRRRGIASDMLDIAEKWARDNALNCITAPLQSKNHPAIALLSQRGYSFCGYVDNHFCSGESALLYSLHTGPDSQSAHSYHSPSKR